MRLIVALVIGILGFTLGVLGNLLASWMQQSVFNNVFNTPSITVIVIGAIIVIVLTAIIRPPAATTSTPSRTNLSRPVFRFVLPGILIICLVSGFGGGFLLYPRISNIFGVETPDQLYSRVIDGTPILNDDLVGPGKYQWDQGQFPSGSCKFTNGAYQISTSNPNNTQDCHAEATNFSNFAFQTRMVMNTGSGGGLVFRSTVIQPGVNRSYRFRISPDGSWDLVCISCGNFGTIPIIQGVTDNIHGIGGINIVTIIAEGSNLYLYVNDKFLKKANDDLFNIGRIGLFAVNFSPSPDTTIMFYNVKIWNV
jgi:hypothetical protein